MTGEVYTVAGGKGGVGKTTTVVNVAVALQEIGHDVAVVDADLGMPNLGAMLGIEHEPGLHRVLAGEAAVSDALTEGPGGITVLPGERDLEAFADADPANLRKVVESLSTAYEIVLVDTSAGLSHDVTVPLGIADGVVLVTTTDDVAVVDALKTVELAERIDGEVTGAVLTRVNGNTDVAAVADELDLEVLAVVPEDEKVPAGKPLVVYHPDSQAAESYRRLASALGETDEATTEGDATDEWVETGGEPADDGDDDSETGRGGVLRPWDDGDEDDDSETEGGSLRPWDD